MTCSKIQQIQSTFLLTSLPQLVPSNIVQLCPTRARLHYRTQHVAVPRPLPAALQCILAGTSACHMNSLLRLPAVHSKLLLLPSGVLLATGKNLRASLTGLSTPTRLP